MLQTSACVVQGMAIGCVVSGTNDVKLEKIACRCPRAKVCFFKQSRIRFYRSESRLEWLIHR
jgi:hypothetical protein